MPTDAGFVFDQRIIREARVAQGIGHDHRRIAQNRVPTKGNAARRLGHVESLARLEPLPLRIDQRNQGDGDIKKMRRDSGDPVEAFLGRGTENA